MLQCRGGGRSSAREFEIWKSCAFKLVSTQTKNQTTSLRCTTTLGSESSRFDFSLRAVRRVTISASFGHCALLQDTQRSGLSKCEKPGPGLRYVLTIQNGN